ncbi:DNA polymerase gamma [Podospora fimiseda]|uniref:DNA-directed DNA polymerase n=1 Tax=Podospora fimiseda TaxID=252190 RepID=A0AAN7H280_9PEZI|nr:DNA polymerase gamma [Podospora fimiseda]
MMLSCRGFAAGDAPVASFVRLAKHRAAARRSYLRPLTSFRSFTISSRRWTSQRDDDTLAVPCTARHNEIGVQQLSSHLYQQLFPSPEDTSKPSPELVKLAEDHLRRHDLLGKVNDTSDPIAFDLPPLAGTTLDEHFYKLGLDAAEPFLSYAKEFARSNLPPKPKEWIRQSGWTKYYPDTRLPEAVEAPEGNFIAFDTEVMWKDNQFAVMACAATPDAWYAWLSPWLLGETENKKQLIPLGDPTKGRIVVGHNIGYDRARILEEYDLSQSRNFFLDTMSLHVAVNGMCSQQRPTWMKHKKNRELREKITKEASDVKLVELLNSGAFSAEEEELWVERSSINSLRDVAKFHLGLTIDKEIRNSFGELDRDGVNRDLDELLTYCAADVVVTHRVYQMVLPNFLDTCPHPVSFAALRHLASVILPVNKKWDAYIANAEATYNNLAKGIKDRLIALAKKAREVKKEPEKYNADPWLKQLDWSIQETRYKKKKKPDDTLVECKNQKLPGEPKWFKDLHQTSDRDSINISVRVRTAPLLLRLSWDGYPLVWSEIYGWTFMVPRNESEKYTAAQMLPCDMSDEKILYLRDDLDHVYFKLPHKDGPSARCVNPMAKSYLVYFENGTLNSEYSYAKEALEMNASCSYWISARDRIMNQLVVYENDLPGWTPAKPETRDETELQTSATTETAEAEIEPTEEEIEAMAVKMGARMVDKESATDTESLATETDLSEEVMESLGIIYEDSIPIPETESLATATESTEIGTESATDATSLATEADLSEEAMESMGRTDEDSIPIPGFILPQVIPMGTITRRAVENTWLTASNAKKNRVGSELKAMVRAPPGYVFVGADVDSEELWIASVVGDATFKIHGGNAIGFMTLEGTKAAGTDLHSRTASILGITRNNAKVFNYGRIYGAGLKFAAQLLRQFNPTLSEVETLKIAGTLYATTKGTKTTRKILHRRPFWRGGTESFVFNKLEEFAEQERPRTPVLGAGITQALNSKFISKGGYLTSRINWAIQSSGVDYLHLLIVSMDYLIRRFNIEARLAITVHDEIRYLVKEHDKYRAAMALQVANLWTRVMFTQQVGIDDLPQSCAFFSAVDIDTVLRKEVDMDCVTPSNPIPIPHGESIDINGLLQKGNLAKLDQSIKPEKYPPKLDKYEYVPRKPVMQELLEKESMENGGEEARMRFIRAQITNDDDELKEILKEVRKAGGGLFVAERASSSSSRKSVLPYHSSPRLMPTAEQREPMSVREAFGGSVKYRTSGVVPPAPPSHQSSSGTSTTSGWRKGGNSIHGF